MRSDSCNCKLKCVKVVVLNERMNKHINNISFVAKFDQKGIQNYKIMCHLGLINTPSTELTVALQVISYLD